MKDFIFLLVFFTDSLILLSCSFNYNLVGMLINDQSLALQQTVQQMGFNSLEDFALEQAREKLFNEIKICTTNTEQFEKKYGVDYADFCKNFTQLQQPVFEKEDDSAEWNAELKQLNILQKRLARLI